MLFRVSQSTSISDNICKHLNLFLCFVFVFVFAFVFVFVLFFVVITSNASAQKCFIHILTDPCNSSPCLNGGQCQLMSNGAAYSCSCQNGFTGSRCETPSKLNGFFFSCFCFCFEICTYILYKVVGSFSSL